jgi:ATP synthase protein I
MIQKKTEKSDRKQYGDYLSVSSIGIHLVLSSIVGCIAGIYIDKWLNTTPAFTIILFLIGLFSGFWQIFKEVKRIGQDKK